MVEWTRRQFLEILGAATAVPLLIRPAAGREAAPAATVGILPANHVYVAKNGDSVTNVQAVLDLAGGVARLVGYDDVVVLKPNGQWSRQGYTHTLCLKALIDIILNRPGGFAGEVAVAEHVHRRPDEVATGAYCWYMPAGGSRERNWPDMHYMGLVDHYHQNGFPRVWACPLYDVSTDAAHWAAVTGPAQLASLHPGKHGWVRLATYTAANGRSLYPSYPVLRSPFSGKLVDLHRGGGVWENGGYTGQRVTLIFLPTLNNHGSGAEDYAGITSAVKCHIGFQEGTSLHSVGYNTGHPGAVGESVGHLLTNVLEPAFYLTCAEWSGHQSRTGSATRTRTVGLCGDPVTLDYWMCKNVLYPCLPVPYFDPDQDNNTRKTLAGCQAKGAGTLDPAGMTVSIADLA